MGSKQLHEPGLGTKTLLPAARNRADSASVSHFFGQKSNMKLQQDDMKAHEHR